MKRFLYSVVGICLSVFLIGTANADMYFDTTITPEERAVFAFFRAAEVPPDYDFWLKSTPAFEELKSDKQKEDYMIKEMLRLGRGYGEFDVNKDLLELKTNIISRYHPASDTKPARITFRFFALTSNNTPTFNYSFGSGALSLILNRLDYFSDLKLSEAEDAGVSQKVPYANDDFDATLFIHARVERADYENKILQGSRFIWPMFGKIGFIKCVYKSPYTQKEEVLWDYLAPWYEEQYNLANMPEEQKYPHPYDLFKD